MTTRVQKIVGRFAVASFAGIGGFQADAEPLHVVYAEDVVPLSWGDAGSVRGGLVDAVDLIATRAKIPVKHAAFPWARAQQMVRAGKADAFVTVRTPERQQYTICVEQPVLTLTYRAFVSRSNPQIEKIAMAKTRDELGAFTLGSYLGSGWGKSNLSGLNVDVSPTLNVAIRKMLINRVDVVIGPQEIVAYHLDGLAASAAALKLSVDFSKVEFRFCVGRESPFAASIPRLSKALADTRSDGSLARIYLRYHLGTKEAEGQ